MIKSYFKGIEKEIIQSIYLSEKRIVIAVAWFTNHNLFEALLTKLKQGVEVKLCLINDLINNRDDGVDFEKFIVNGGLLYFGKDDELMHHKFCIIDNNILYNGSYNWTYYAENRNRENVIKFEGYKELVADFNNEFNTTINRCDSVLFYHNYIENNAPTYSQDLNKYLSYDLMYQAKREHKQGCFAKSKSTISKAIVKNKINTAAKVELTKIEVKNESSISTNTKEDIKSVDTNKIDYPSILRKHEQEIFNNYFSENPNRQKAYEHARAIYEYESSNDFKYINYYDPVIPGYIMMIFGKYVIADLFFSKTQNALGYYDKGVLSLLLNNKPEFKKYINHALNKLGQRDENCSALYIPRMNGGMVEYIEKKLNSRTSKETISLKETILSVKKQFKI